MQRSEKTATAAQPVSTFGLFLIAVAGALVLQGLFRLSLYFVCPGLALFFSVASPLLSRTLSSPELLSAGASSGTAIGAMYIGFWVAELSLFRRRDESDTEQRKLKPA
eukprot:CAMPEP_0196749988 /NCGR_PEP_ID=MMETSP1091-20130531/79030_1 /TAXON_ID=302021 /ORGANISM="Rhodomonas sp., Strain CCMP768" /LENGTH=107 /DNA_ID=CAMNT_0042097545 /DNA_START=1 /DNA_END=321 /DNA_ORIENTATION=+